MTSQLRSRTNKLPQLLKWVGNKHRFAGTITSYFPEDIGTYFEPFLGSGAVLGNLAPQRAVASDVLEPLIGIWEYVKSEPDELVQSYDRYRSRIDAGEDKRVVYQEALDRFNSSRDPRDFMFLSRACYGGVIRFRKRDGYMSTPCGAHTPISTASFAARIEAWRPRIASTEFLVSDYAESFSRATAGDLVYCDPPYVDTQKILYGAQEFRFAELIEQIADAKRRGVRVALSIDGSKRDGSHTVVHDIPMGLFESEVDVSVGKSMLRRFQMDGKQMEGESVSDKLFLTYVPALSSLF